MKIITLADNVVTRRRLLAEHGHSIYPEVDNSRVLFDTGESSVFYKMQLNWGLTISFTTIEVKLLIIRAFSLSS